ncbi:MAG: glutathione S-transferase [Alphaproteobacteria bacterium]|nr:glutathione S-transferase [Alphaproteobacteria bacterium]
MSEIIFHHYWTSPFSEKVRNIFGMKGISWRSVEQPTIMPKPHLIPLTGGYRKIPVMQIGADIYCDSQLILREVERRFPGPKGEANGISAPLGFWADRAWFPAGIPLIFSVVGDTIGEAFKKDREAMSGAPFDTDRMKQAVPLMREQFRAHTGFVEEQLAAHGDFLTGKPTVLDAQAYMNIWFLTSFVPQVAEPLLKEFTRVNAWAARMKAIGYGKHEKMAREEALAVAKGATSTTREQADPNEPNGLKPGQKVNVMPDDYGKDPIAGVLVASSLHEVAIRREHPEVGEVVVHFPRAGFWVLPA